MADTTSRAGSLALDHAQPPSRVVSGLLITLGIAIILLGVGLRIVQLPSRILFFDEAYTQIRVAGYTVEDVERALFDGRPHPAMVVRAYAQVGPNSSPARTLASLAAEDAQHPPLFYLAELETVRVLGDARWAWRALPAFFGVAAIGATWFLARELFDSRAALSAAALFAVSPVERIYSEQAREYSLVTLITLGTTLLLVRAYRKPSFARWAAYAVGATIALYTSTFLIFVLIAHAICVAAISSADRKRILGGFIAAAIAASVIATPWLIEIVTHRDVIASTTFTTQGRWPLAQLAMKWFLNVGTTFFDLECLDAVWLPILVAVVLIGISAAVMGLRDATPVARWVVATLIVVPALMLSLADVVFGEHRTVIARYELPVYAGLSLAVARGIVGRPVHALILLAAGVVACVIGTQHAAWWDNGLDANEPTIATLVNAVPGAQVASSTDPIFAIQFARLFKDDIRMSLHQDLAGAKVDPHQPVFVLNADEPQIAAFSRATSLRFEAVQYPHSGTAHAVGRLDGALALANGALAQLHRVGVNVRIPELRSRADHQGANRSAPIAVPADTSEILSLARAVHR